MVVVVVGLGAEGEDSVGEGAHLRSSRPHHWQAAASVRGQARAPAVSVVEGLGKAPEEGLEEGRSASRVLQGGSDKPRQQQAVVADSDREEEALDLVKPVGEEVLARRLVVVEGVSRNLEEKGSGKQVEQ